MKKSKLTPTTVRPGVILFAVISVLILGGLLYYFVSSNTDIRSKAAAGDFQNEIISRYPSPYSGCKKTKGFLTVKSISDTARKWGVQIKCPTCYHQGESTQCTEIGLTWSAVWDRNDSTKCLSQTAGLTTVSKTLTACP